MHIHEYQAKRLLSAYGVPTPEGRLAATPGEAEQAARDLPGPVWVVKAQIHAGGRGKAGGVKMCRSPEEAREAAASLLGARLVTPQTGPDGERVNAVWIERGTASARECYLAVALDRASQCLTVMASPGGGMDIEAVAASSPERVFTARLDGGHYLWPFQARNLLEGWGLESGPARELASLVRRLAALAAEKDMTQLEINPLALSEGGGFVALDAKMNFDDSALKRHPDIVALRDTEEGDPLERAAAEKGLTYVRLGGSIGTLVNGAGLAMATMDAIKQAGAEPANFLDAGGGASEETVAAGFSIMLSDPHVRGILINIFGGARHRERGPQTGHRRAAGGAARRDQRGGRAAHPPGKRPPVPHRFLHVRGGPPDRRARGGIPSGGRCMSILIDDGSRVLVQGITGREGQFHTERMIRYGTRVVGGVTPGRGGQPTLGVPVFDSVRQAVRETEADVSVAFVPAALAADAACEASEAGIRLVVVIAEHVPVLDMVRVKAFFRGRGTLLVGPNCPGIISPGKCKVGIMPGYIHRPGVVGLVSRSGTLTYEAVHQLTAAGLGQSSCVGIGGDPIHGLSFVDLLKLYGDDPETEAVCLIGEIGGDAEERAAEYIRSSRYPKPVFGFIAGLTAPPGKRMGHAGAIISGTSGRGEDKIAAFEEAGVTVIRELGSFGSVVAQKLL